MCLCASILVFSECGCVLNVLLPQCVSERERESLVLALHSIVLVVVTGTGGAVSQVPGNMTMAIAIHMNFLDFQLCFFFVSKAFPKM